MFGWFIFPIYQLWWWTRYDVSTKSFTLLPECRSSWSEQINVTAANVWIGFILRSGILFFFCLSIPASVFGCWGKTMSCPLDLQTPSNPRYSGNSWFVEKVQVFMGGDRNLLLGPSIHYLGSKFDCHLKRFVDLAWSLSKLIYLFSSWAVFPWWNWSGCASSRQVHRRFIMKFIMKDTSCHCRASFPWRIDFSKREKRASPEILTVKSGIWLSWMFLTMRLSERVRSNFVSKFH